MKIDPTILALKEEVTRWRRDFHENPEILYEVHRTAGIVAEKLKALSVANWQKDPNPPLEAKEKNATKSFRGSVRLALSA